MHWVALFAIVLVGWLLLAVVGGWLLGRGLGAFERRNARRRDVEVDEGESDELRHAA